MSDPGAEPGLGDAPGCGMDRARHDGESPRRREFGGSPTGLLWRRLAGVPAILWLVALAALVWMAGVLLGLTIFGLAYGGMSLAAWSFPGSRFFSRSNVDIVVGADGLLVSDRFFSYSEIINVRCEGRREPGSGYSGYGTWLPEEPEHIDLHYSLQLTGGRMVDLSEHATGELRNAIDEARAAWLVGQCDAGVEHDVVARGNRTALEWLHALRSLGSSASGAYRAVSLDLERVSRLLDNPREKPSLRVAAAIVLSAAGDPLGARKLRIWAGSTAAPPLRFRLEKIADASDDVALAEALEALDDADGEERSMTARRSAELSGPARR